MRVFGVALVVPYVFVAFALPTRWEYSLHGEKDRTTLIFSEPKMSIVFQGLSDESSFERGALMVSGLGYYASEEHSSTGYFERMHYSWGVAEIQINDRVVRITDFGRKLTYKGKTIDIPGKSPLNLVIDASGRLSRTGNEEKQ